MLSARLPTSRPCGGVPRAGGGGALAQVLINVDCAKARRHLLRDRRYRIFEGYSEADRLFVGALLIAERLQRDPPSHIIRQLIDRRACRPLMRVELELADDAAQADAAERLCTKRLKAVAPLRSERRRCHGRR